VVPVGDPSGVLARLQAETVRVHAAFHPIADVKRAAAAGYEVVLGLPGEPPRSPRGWAGDVHVAQAGAVEAPLLAAALSALERLPEKAFLLVNVSAHGLLSSEVADTFAAAGRLERLVVVVTHDTDDADPVDVRRALDAVRDRAATVAVDETGSGYSSLRGVLRLRPDFVRIGGEFIREIDRDQAKAAVVESVAHLASRMDAWMIASGVASAVELDVLARMGVPLAQGPLFGEALEEMAPLSRAAVEVLHDAAPPPTAEATVGGLVEARPAIPWGAPIEDLADTFLDDPRHDVLVLVDERSRPLALAERAALLRGEPYERPVMRITPSSPLKAAARRAAGRPVMERFHPLVVCDRRGVYLGIVRVEQLLDALAQ
jgi:EAL domain-containing protein (putative c-di-GMP-specific phosphodiesterase class I)